MNTVTASFNTTVRQMTEKSQWPKCLGKKWQKCLSEKSSLWQMQRKRESCAMYKFWNAEQQMQSVRKSLKN